MQSSYPNLINIGLVSNEWDEFKVVMKYVYNVHFYRHLNMINVCLFIYTILSAIIFIYSILKYSLGIGYSSVQKSYQKSLENSFTKEDIQIWYIKRGSISKKKSIPTLYSQYIPGKHSIPDKIPQSPSETFCCVYHPIRITSSARWIASHESENGVTPRSIFKSQQIHPSPFVFSHRKSVISTHLSR